MTGLQKNSFNFMCKHNQDSSTDYALKISKRERDFHHLRNLMFIGRLCSYASVSSICALLPPPGNWRAFARLVSPVGGALSYLVQPEDWALASPRGTPEKFVDVFKDMF